MKILWIAQRDLLQDLNVATWLEMTKSLANKNHNITLVSLSTSSKKFQQQQANLNIKELRVINQFPLVAITFHLQLIILSLIWLFTIRPNIIITHPYTNIFLLPVYLLVKLLRLKIKFVLDIRTVPVRLINMNDRIKKALNNVAIYTGKIFFDGITVITPALKKVIIDQFQFNSKKIGTWMSGVNINLFQPQTDFVKTTKEFVVMYHGVIAENRGIIETIQAMALVIKKIPVVKLTIVGKGLAIGTIKQLVEQLQLHDSVRLEEAVAYNKIPAFISKADIGIIPLPDELCWNVSSPLKLIEYLAMAKPVIVSPIEAHTTFLNGCAAAIFLKSTSPQDISDGIIKAYTIQKQLGEMGAKGRKYVMNNFTWDQQASKLEKYLTHL